MSRHKLSLFVFIDAFGWELLLRYGFLETILPHRQPVATVPGYSSTCVPTILTGRLPREHGHFSSFYYSPSTSPFGRLRALGLLPDRLMQRGRVRGALSRVVARQLGYSGYFQLYAFPLRHIHQIDYLEKQDLYEPGGIVGGVPTIFDHLRRHGVSFHKSDWRRSEPENLRDMAMAFERRPRCGYLYLAALDGLLHRHGTQAPEIEAKIRWYEHELARLVETAEQHYEEVEIHIFSDHGMNDVTETLDLSARLERSGCRFGKDYFAILDSTMARFWFLEPSARSRIESVLREVSQGRMLDESWLHDHGCDFPNNRFGELFFLMNPGVLINPSHMGSTPLAGMHGYAPETPEAVAMLASNVQAQPSVARLDDLFELMASSAGVSVSPSIAS